MNDFVGWASAVNATEKVYVRLADEPGGSYITEIGDGKPVQLKAGNYMLDGENQNGLAQFDVAPGEELTIDVNDFVGWASAVNATEKAYVRLADEPGGSYIAEIGDGKPVQLKAGSYRLDGENQNGLAQFDVAPGEELTIDVNDFVGWASAVNATEKVYVRLADASGGSYIAEIGDGKSVPLKAGNYRLDGENQNGLAQFDVAPGEELTIDVNDFVGWASAVNATEKVYVRLADASGGSYIAEIGDGKSVQLKAGNYRLDGENQKGLTQFDVTPGEEIVIDFDG